MKVLVVTVPPWRGGETIEILAQVVEPFLTIGTADGDRQVASNYAGTSPDLTVAMYFTSKSYAAKNPKVVSAFTSAMTKSLDYATAHPDEVRAVLSSYLKLDSSVQQNLTLPKFPSTIDTASVQQLAGLATQDGLLTKQPDLTALLPLVVLIYGSRVQSALVLVVYAAFWQVLVPVLYGVADVDPVVRDTARTYRFSRWAVIRNVVWPTTLPYVVTGFRLAASVALILEVTAELIIGVPGLGKSIGVAQSSGAVNETYALVLVVGIIGVAVNASARAVERRVLRWHTSIRRDL